MAAEFYAITRDEMIEFLTARDYDIIEHPGHEIVMEKTISRHVFQCGGFRTVVRVFTSIVGDSARGCGTDAIRVVSLLIPGGHMLTAHLTDPSYPELHDAYPIEKKRRVHRVVNWKENLGKRLVAAEKIKVRKSPRKWPMVLRVGKYGEFWSSLMYPNEKYTETYNVL